MNRNTTLSFAAAVAVSALASGCGYDRNPPILVAVSDTVGISASGGASDQGADLTLGFKGRKLAVVPVSVTLATGDQALIALRDGSENKEKSHSVLATLYAQGAAGTTSASVEQVVAVGPAAEVWAKNHPGKPE